MNTEWTILEKRKRPRSKVYLGGLITCDERFPTVKCLVRNISDDGAMILVSGKTMISEVFDLDIPWSKTRRRAREIWRTQDAVGVVFDVDPSHHEPRSRPAVRLRDQEREDARSEMRSLMVGMRQSLRAKNRNAAAT